MKQSLIKTHGFVEGVGVENIKGGHTEDKHQHDLLTKWPVSRKVMGWHDQGKTF